MNNSPNFSHNNHTSYDMKNISDNSREYEENNKKCRRNIKHMRATGIVRRIDDLGRVVVPKEIRRILKIREGDPLEIYTDKEGEIILKKYSPIGELAEFAKEYAEAIANVSGYKAIITDRDQVIAVSGGVKKEYQGRGITDKLEEVMNNREVVVTGAGKRNIEIIDGDDYRELGQVICPISCEGDIIGSVIVMGKDKNAQIGEAESKLATVAAVFLAKQMENR